LVCFFLGFYFPFSLGNQRKPKETEEKLGKTKKTKGNQRKTIESTPPQTKVKP
jgi:hypothetical protein